MAGRRTPYLWLIMDKAARQLRQAAKWVDKHRSGACSALSYYAYNVIADEKARRIFMRFAPTDSATQRLAYWWGHPVHCDDKSHNARVMALLLAAEMAEDEYE